MVNNRCSPNYNTTNVAIYIQMGVFTGSENVSETSHHNVWDRFLTGIGNVLMKVADMLKLMQLMPQVFKLADDIIWPSPETQFRAGEALV